MLHFKDRKMWQLRKKWPGLVFWGVLVLAGGIARAQWDKGTSLFADHKAHEVGDVVTIYIIEFSKGSNEAVSSTRKEDKLSASGGGQNALKFIPLFGFDANTKIEHDGDAATSRKGSLQAKMSARIIEKMANGLLKIEGSRVIDINGEKQVTILTGIVRPEDITANNIVYSYNIADAQITYKGKGMVNSGQRPGFLMRLINWLF
ncbi:MAG: flagellar basal body L-ring protein FlgH [candidate division KSB1 bacterium]|nr:flagellar basal body L-ring protein FlgH [candidate division KSB1 bacterium]